MHTPEDMTPAERELEESLRALRPLAEGMDAAELAFRLGEAAGRRRVRRWQGSTLLMGLGGMAAVLGVLATRGAPGPGSALPLAAAPEMPAPRTLATQAPTRATAPPALEGLFLTSSYVRQRERAVRLEPGAPVILEWAPALRVDGAPADRAGEDGVRRTEQQGSLDFFLQALGRGRSL